MVVVVVDQDRIGILVVVLVAPALCVWFGVITVSTLTLFQMSKHCKRDVWLQFVFIHYLRVHRIYCTANKPHIHYMYSYRRSKHITLLFVHSIGGPLSISKHVGRSSIRDLCLEKTLQPRNKSRVFCFFLFPSLFFPLIIFNFFEFLGCWFEF